jgi:hypothetical protein
MLCPSFSLIAPACTKMSNRLSHFHTSKVHFISSFRPVLGFRNKQDIGLVFGVSTHSTTQISVSLSSANSSSTKFTPCFSFSCVLPSLNQLLCMIARCKTWFTSIKSWPSVFSLKYDDKQAKVKSARSLSSMVRL